MFKNLHPVWFVEWRCTRCHAAGCAGIREGGVGAVEMTLGPQGRSGGRVTRVIKTLLPSRITHWKSADTGIHALNRIYYYLYMAVDRQNGVEKVYMGPCNFAAAVTGRSVKSMRCGEPGSLSKGPGARSAPSQIRPCRVGLFLALFLAFFIERLRSWSGLILVCQWDATRP